MSARRAFARELAQASAAADWEQSVLGAEILADIRESVRPMLSSRRRNTWRSKIGAIGAAASLAMSVAVAEDTHSREMIAAPMGSEVEPVAESEGLPPAGKAADMKVELVRNALNEVAEQIKPVQAVEIELWLSNTGEVVFAGLYKPPEAGAEKKPLPAAEQINQLVAGLGGKRTERKQAARELRKLGRSVLPFLKVTRMQSEDPEIVAQCRALIKDLEPALEVENRAAILKYLRSLSFKQTQLTGKRFRVEFTKDEIARAATPQIRTHIFEMAPAPLD